ncbi:hypothetical protein EXIGLDRAFT_830252 [Exidia glandulosa HHB12029]|uniref:MYND-type domain-containing protein n=1 Tax=Exidia glandulosa HHB12029 TaxID=1314781 RepID=A0A165NPT8_EXIGL|nr:hypothetical protein EXIGLDRAFT_830252 [Exidia glandulosa HHB12029]
MESQAHALALALAAESDLALCPVCFLTFREQLEDNLAVHRLRVNAHPFWTSLMRFVTVARVYTAGICERISERLWMNWCRCRQCRPSSALQNVNRTRPFFEMTMRSACRLLHLCLSVPSKHGRPLRVFAHNRGLWPTTREQLVPYGAPQTIRALVQCHRNLTPTMALIVMLLIRFRPLLYPEIVKDDNRLPLVSSLITTIECYAYDAPNSQRTRLSGTPEGTFLYLLKEGPGVQADDARQFTVGQELELYHALVQLPTSPHCADEQSWWTYSMTVLMLSLLERLPVEERADPPYFLRDFVEQTSRRTRHPYVDFRGMYRYVQDHGSCFGPGCDKAPPSYTFSLMEAKAHTHAKALEDPHHPSVCSACLMGFLDEIMRDIGSLRGLRANCHDFWNALMRFTTVERTVESRMAMKAELFKIRRRCRATHSPRNMEDSLLIDVFTRCCATLAFCLNIGANPMTNVKSSKAFGSKRGLWPTEPDQLLPYGAKTSITTLKVWYCSLLALPPISLLGSILICCRHLAFPEVCASPVREHIIESTIETLKACVQVAQPHLQKFERQWRGRTTPRGARKMSLMQHVGPIRAIGLVLDVIARGPDAHRDDQRQFARGYEKPLYDVVCSCLPFFDDDDEMKEWLAYFVTVLHTELQLPDSDLPAFARASLQNLAEEVIDPYRAMRKVLETASSRRDCRGPGCGKSVHESGTGKPFPRCSGCKLVQYCTKECQKADWTHGIPHKEICGIIKEVWTYASLEMDPHEFEKACRAHHLPKDRAMRVIEWVMMADSIPKGSTPADVAKGKAEIEKLMENTTPEQRDALMASLNRSVAESGIKRAHTLTDEERARMWNTTPTDIMKKLGLDLDLDID